MRKWKALIQTAVTLCLAALLTVPALAAEPPDPAMRQEDLDFLYEEILMKHPGLFTKHPESEFLAVKAEIEERLETVSNEEFLLDLMRLTALAGDSHTMISVGNAASFRAYPFALVRRGERWYLSAAAPENQALLGQEVTHIAGRPVEEVVEAFGALFPSDNPVHLRRQFRQACNVADIYEYLGLVEPGAPLPVTLAGILPLEPMNLADIKDLVYLSSQIKNQPATAAANAYYFAKPLTDSVYYIQYNICREAEDLPMEDFALQVAQDLDAGTYSRVLLDLRNNGGGSDGVIWPLFEVLRDAMDGGCELVGLIGEQTFSSALINAVEVQEMGGVLVGEDAGGSVCHFGAVQVFSLPNSGIRGQLSSKYIDVNTLLDAGAGRGVVALAADVSISQTMKDTLNGRDTVVEWLLVHPERLEQKAFPNAPLTRGRFIGLLYEAAGIPDVTVRDLPFADSFGIEWYLPAVAWAKETGIAMGGADGTFSAARAITWREAAVFLARTAESLGIPEPEPTAYRAGPVPEALAQGWEQDAVAKAWALGLLPSDADFSKGLTRTQGEALTEALGALMK